MAGELKIKQGTKLRMALDADVGKEPSFSYVCTFFKALDESAFLVSVPLAGGKPMAIDDNQKLLFRYGSGDDEQIVAGYADDTVKVGIRHYWRIRRVMEQRRFFKRADVRMKVELPVQYMQPTWALNSDGEIDWETGQTMDISNGGLAVMDNRWFEVGQTCVVRMPRVGTASSGASSQEVVGVVCWMRELPKGSTFRFVMGLQLRFAEPIEREHFADYVAIVQKQYKL